MGARDKIYIAENNPKKAMPPTKLQEMANKLGEYFGNELERALAIRVSLEPSRIKQGIEEVIQQYKGHLAPETLETARSIAERGMLEYLKPLNIAERWKFAGNILFALATLAISTVAPNLLAVAAGLGLGTYVANRSKPIENRLKNGLEEGIGSYVNAILHEAAR